MTLWDVCTTFTHHRSLSSVVPGIGQTTNKEHTAELKPTSQCDKGITQTLLDLRKTKQGAVRLEKPPQTGRAPRKLQQDKKTQKKIIKDEQGAVKLVKREHAYTCAEQGAVRPTPRLWKELHASSTPEG